MTWGPPVIKFIHICMGKFPQKVYGWRFVDGKKWLTKHFFDKKHLKKNFFLNKIKIFAE